MTDQGDTALFKPSTDGLSRDEVIQLYNEWPSYEQDVLSEECVGHVIAAKALASFYPIEDRADVKILDIGAGTGLVGIELKEHGFSQIDALEPSICMVKQAKERRIYNKYINEFMSSAETCSIKTDTYGGVISVGAFCGTHIPSVCLEDVVRVVKPGGMIIVVIRRDLEEGVTGGLKQISRNLEKEGKLEIVQLDHLEKFRKGFEGILFSFKVL